MPDPTAGSPSSRRHLIRRLYDSTVSWAERPGGTWALVLIAFAESSFFPIPPDVLLVALCVGASRASFRFAPVSAVGSVAGGAFGWVLGASAWHALKGIFIPYVFAQSTFDHVQALYRDNAFLAILTAAFTPIPYKVFTVAAVFFAFGRQMRALIERYFDLFAWALLALGIVGFVAIRFLR